MWGKGNVNINFVFMPNAHLARPGEILKLWLVRPLVIGAKCGVYM
jgi:hypothetical protein